MGETGRHEQLVAAFRRQFDRVVSAEGRRTRTQIHHHVQNGAAHASHQLGLRIGWFLEV
ncbi:hypothetical protein D3C87_1868800 [compost metagenome]